ncbi:LytTR family DNA-binding domain-containing protein [Nostocoides veronense]|uniref:LytTR family DNA-binding domain-containing protein n=1 Tax=Nostocoides veronense TaxID=330836 RepID=A0ABN2L9C9_9MICO
MTSDSHGLIALVVDDEAPARSELRYLLEQDERIAGVRVAASGTDALRVLENEPVDVVFSDISMPGLDGMELARVLARFAHRPAVVFVTAHDQHAVDAFAISAVDYVMKPVRPERLAEAVRRVVGAVAPAPESRDEDETIPVELGGITRFVSRRDIRYVQAHGDYVRLHTDTGSHLVRIPLNTLEERWAAAGFVRIHRSTLVSLKHVTQVRMDHGKASVRVGDTDLPVSRRHMRELRQQLLTRPTGS